MSSAPAGMPATKKRKWIEVGATYLSDGPPKRTGWEAYLFLLDCTYNPSTKIPVLRRKTRVQTIKADSKTDLAPHYIGNAQFVCRTLPKGDTLVPPESLGVK